MILESRKFAVHDSNFHDNNHRESKNTDKTKNTDIGDDEIKVVGREQAKDDVTKDEVENKGEENRIYSVTCSYYRPVLVIRDEKSKHGVRRACVLLGENGMYVRSYGRIGEHSQTSAK